MKIKQLNLSEKLQRKQRQRWHQPVYGLGGLSLLVLVIVSLLLWGLPRHGQLFFHWLVRGGDVTQIPVHLHSEIRELCSQAGPNGQVNSYQSHPEIANGLGQFECRRSLSSESWEISDQYGFAKVSEAAAGTQLAEVLVALVGTNYFYQIKGTVPLKKSSTN